MRTTLVLAAIMVAIISATTIQSMSSSSDVQVIGSGDPYRDQQLVDKMLAFQKYQVQYIDKSINRSLDRSITVI
jgi:hypothetical protein